MLEDNDSVILIGMPGAGKSTLGVMLAKQLALGFVDTDLLIQSRTGCTLQELLNKQGYLALRQVEEQVLLDHQFPRTVVATGGSAVYSDAAMKQLQEQGVIVFLDVSAEQLRQRIHNYETRGIARRPDQSFRELFDERHRLYSDWADITISCSDKPADSILNELIDALHAYSKHA